MYKDRLPPETEGGTVLFFMEGCFILFSDRKCGYTCFVTTNVRFIFYGGQIFGIYNSKEGYSEERIFFFYLNGRYAEQ